MPSLWAKLIKIAHASIILSMTLYHVNISREHVPGYEKRLMLLAYYHIISNVRRTVE